MAYVAGVTTRIKLATGILILPQHNPVISAKQIATLDHLSGGRILLGIGVGWLKEEFEALGVPFDDRGRRTDEYINAMRELWTSDKPTLPASSSISSDAYCRATRRMARCRSSSVGIRCRPRAGRAAWRRLLSARGARPISSPPHARPLPKPVADPDALDITVSLPHLAGGFPALASSGVERVLVPVSGMADWRR